MFRFCLRSLAIGAMSSIALGNVALAATAEQVKQLQDQVDEFKSLIPPEYNDAIASRRGASDDGFATAFGTQRDAADCKFGLRFGRQMARSLIARLRPSCDRLLAPIGTEWIPPEQPEQSAAFAKCFDHAFSWNAMQTVYATADLCAWQGFESSFMAGQIEYNRCYLSVASSVSLANVVRDPYQPGRLALVPTQSDRWTTMLSSIRSRHGAQSGYLSMVCELGKSDAESGLPLANILLRSNQGATP